jgi:hypothetical protein
MNDVTVFGRPRRPVDENNFDRPVPYPADDRNPRTLKPVVRRGDGAAALTRAGRPEIDRSQRAIGNNREI